jgi:hypothetical protein
VDDGLLRAGSPTVFEAVSISKVGGHALQESARIA